MGARLSMSSRMVEIVLRIRGSELLNECEDDEVVKRVKLEGFGFRGLA